MELGIDNLKKALAEVISIGEKVDNVLEDGKIGLFEWPNLAISSIGIWRVVRNAKSIIKEYRDLDDKERDELIAFIAQELDLRNDRVEFIIESSLAFILQASVFTQGVSEARA